MANRSALREHWGSRVGFILAAAGSAVGLGNVWKFPFITGMYGGAAFVLWYLISILFIGLPVMLIEFAVGRLTQRNPVGAFRALAPGGSYFLIGVLGVASGFIILSYYSVVAGWTLAYVFKAVASGFGGFHTPEVAAAEFQAYAAHPVWSLLTHGLFAVLCALIVARGVRGGVERWNRILMPLLFLIVLVLVLRGVTLPNAGAGIRFLFAPDFSKLTGNGMLVAMGHAFFTLSLGMGAMLTYGSYLDRTVNLVRSALWIIVADTAVSLLAAAAVFSTVFALGFSPDKGPSLVFNVLPAIFAVMPGGRVVGILFFFLLAIAALTSGISLLEVVVAYWTDERGWDRKSAAWVMAGVIFLLGVPSALSFGVLGSVKVIGMSIFELLDYLSFKYLLPIGGLLMTLFTVFRWGSGSFLGELRSGMKVLRLGKRSVDVLLLISAVFIALTFLAGLLGKI